MLCRVVVDFDGKLARLSSWEVSRRGVRTSIVGDVYPPRSGTMTRPSSKWDETGCSPLC